MVHFFRTSDFRELLKELVEQKKATLPGFNFSKLAEILGMQKTYLSKIMSGQAYLSADQTYMLAEYFSLTKEEHDYLYLLIECEKTGLAQRKQALEKRIRLIQSAHRSTKKNLKAQFRDEALVHSRAEYYLNPFMTIAHLFLTLTQVNGDSKKVKQRLNLDEDQAKKIFSGLERMGIIEALNSPGFYRVVEDHLQLAGDSELAKPYQMLFRAASAQQMIKVPSDDQVSFSVTFSADEKTKKLIHEAFLKFLREIEPAVKAAPAENVFQLHFDLFPWG